MLLRLLVPLFTEVVDCALLLLNGAARPFSPHLLAVAAA